MKKFDVAHLSVARSRYRSLACWAVLALFVTSVPAFAQTTVWTDAIGGWFSPANWSAGVPDSSTTAQINNGGTAQIMASDAAASEVDLGVAAGDMGTLSVSGAGMLQVGGLMNVGENGTGTLSITQGGQASSTNGFIGDGSDSNGTVSVAGANSTWSNSGNVYVGGNASGAVGSGQLQIVNDGTVGAAAITVWSTGSLTGKGFVQAALVTNHGTLTPDSIISISGDLTFDSAATMLSTVTPNVADSVMVGGTAGLDGNLDVTLTENPFVVGMQYTLLTANGGLNGTTFANVSITAPPGVTAQVTYDTNNVVLTIESSATPTPTATTTPSATPRQTATPRIAPTPRPRPTPLPRP